MGLKQMVPNVPCGVESADTMQILFHHPSFLMYRVELKGQEERWLWNYWNRFLMYRVELKGEYYHILPFFFRVPNVPCGVERLISGHISQ